MSTVETLRAEARRHLSRGAIPEAIEHITSATIDSPEVRAGLLEELAEEAMDCEGVLVAQGALHGRVMSALRTARRPDIPHAMERLWYHRRFAHTVAFPVVGGHCPSLLEVRVARHGEPPLGRPLQPETVTGVTAALELAAHVLQAPDRIAELRVELLPRRSDPRWVTGSSLGLAVFLAMVARVRGLALPAHLAVSGCVRDLGLQELETSHVEAKLQALAQRQQLTALLIPSAKSQPVYAEVHKNRLERARDAYHAVELALGERIVRVMVGPSLTPQRSSWLNTPEHEELRLRMLAVLAACQAPVTSDQIEEALGEMSESPSAHGLSVARQIAHWLDDPPPEATLVQAGGGASVARGDSSRAATVAGRGRMRAAHRALGVLAARWQGEPAGGALAAWHARQAGDEDLALARIGATASCSHPDRAHALADRFATTGAPEDISTLAESIPLDSASGGLARIALRCLAAGGPLAQLADPLCSATEPVDQLTALQVAVELPLHLAAALVLAAAREVISDSNVPATATIRSWLRSISHRPSIGGMEDLLDRALGNRHSARGSSPDNDDAGARLRARLGGIGDHLSTSWSSLGGLHFARICNSALHGVGQWAAYYLPGSVTGRPPASESVSALLFAADEVTRHLGPPLRRAQLHLAPSSGVSATPGEHHLFVRPEGVSPLDLHAVARSLHPSGDPCSVGLYRGVVAGRARYWGYEPARDVRVDVPNEDPELVLESTALGEAGQGTLVSFGTSPVLEFALPRPHLLPMPLGAMVAALMDRRTCGSRPWGQRLAFLDLAASTWLRLHVFPAITADLVTGRQRDELLSRPTKMALLRVAHALSDAAVEPGPLATLLAPLRNPATAALAFDTIDALQRFEHTPGPLSRHAGELDGATEAFLALLSRSAFCAESPPTLIALPGTGPAWVLRAFPTSVPAQTVLEGRVDVALEFSQSRLPLGDLAWIERDRAGTPGLWFVAQRQRGQSLAYSLSRNEFYEEKVVGRSQA